VNVPAKDSFFPIIPIANEGCSPSYKLSSFNNSLGKKNDLAPLRLADENDC